MKVKATINFRDREHNLKLRRKGEEFEVTKKRAEKLLSLGYVEKVTETKKTDAAAKGKEK